MIEHPLRRVVRPLGTTESDVELLDRWVAGRDQSAFELLVWRYGAMVLAACRRALPPADAEDAFQATFLVLVRKARSVGRRGSVGGWLHRVAVRVARAARIRAARVAVPLAVEPVALERTDVETRELRMVLDEELDHLPERFRRVLVLCYLQGKTADEAAGELGHPRGTILSWLLRGRERLRSRLVRRGIAPPAAVVLANLERAAGATIPARLVTETLTVAIGGGAAGAASVPAAELAKGVLQAMWWKSAKTFAAGMLMVAATSIGFGLMWQPAEASLQSAPATQPPNPAPGDPRVPVAPAAPGAPAAPAPQPPGVLPGGPGAPAAPGALPAPGGGQALGGARAKVDPNPKKELEKLKGKWQAVEMEFAGEAIPEDGAKRFGMEFTADKVTMKGKLAAGGAGFLIRDGEETYAFKIDPSKKKAEMDIEIKENEPAKGIYKFDGDTLIVCIDYSRSDRPTDFATKDKPAFGMYKLKRVKD